MQQAPGFVLHQGVKTKKHKELGPTKLPCYIKQDFVISDPLYNEVPLYYEKV